MIYTHARSRGRALAVCAFVLVTLVAMLDGSGWSIGNVRPDASTGLAADRGAAGIPVLPEVVVTASRLETPVGNVSDAE
jgi:hypothetical protein